MHQPQRQRVEDLLECDRDHPRLLGRRRPGQAVEVELPGAYAFPICCGFDNLEILRESVFVGLEFHLIELSHVCFSARKKFALNIQISVTVLSVFSGARTLLNQSKIYLLFLTD